MISQKPLVKNHKKYCTLFMQGFLAGIMIAVAAFTYLFLAAYTIARGQTSLESYVLQGLCFCVGIILIVALDAALFTGRIGYLFERPLSYFLELVIMYLANALGAILFTIIFYNSVMPSRVAANGLLYSQVIAQIVNNKLAFSPAKLANIFLGAVGTGVLLHAGFSAYKYAKNKLLGTLALLFSVLTFLLLGFDHCVASFSFFACGYSYDYQKASLFILIVTLGNSIGAINLQTILTLIAKDKFGR